MKSFIYRFLFVVGLGCCLSAPIIAKIGLYDFEDQGFYRVMVVLPLIALTGAIVNRKLVLRRLSGHVIGSVFLLLPVVASLSGLASYLSRPTEATFKYCNDAPFEVGVAVSYRPNRLAEVSEPYQFVAPGKCSSITREFLRTAPIFRFTAGESSNLRRWFASGETEFDLEKFERLNVFLDEAGGTAPNSSIVSTALGSWENGSLAPADRHFSGAPHAIATVHRASFMSVAATPGSTADDVPRKIRFVRGGADHSFAVCNLQPVPASIDIVYRSKRKEWRTERSGAIDAGACEKITRNFQSVEPSFAMRLTIQGDVVEWFFDQRTVEFEGDRSASACMASDQAETIFNTDPAKTACTKGQNKRHFEHVPADRIGGDPVALNLSFSEKDIPLPMRNGQVDIPKAREKIRHLAYLWPRRLAHMERWDGETLPYTLCIETEETDSHNTQGVVVSTACEGSGVSFKPGDVILEFNGHPIFSPIDLEILLLDHAENQTNGGAWNRFTYKAYNGTSAAGIIEERDGIFFFEPTYWSAHQDQTWDWAWAALWGTSSGLLGLERTLDLYCIRVESYEKSSCKFNGRMRAYRLAQFNSASFSVGEFVGKTVIWLPSARVLGRILGGTRLSLAASGATISAIQEFSGMYDSMPPGQNLDGDLKKRVIAAAGEGAIYGILLRR